MLITHSIVTSLLLLALALSACGKMGGSVQNYRTGGAHAGKDLTGLPGATTHQGPGADDTSSPSHADLPVSHLAWDGSSFQGNDTLQVMSVE